VDVETKIDRAVDVTCKVSVEINVTVKTACTAVSVILAGRAVVVTDYLSSVNTCAVFSVCKYLDNRRYYC
jgi:hypothetical protein